MKSALFGLAAMLASVGLAHVAGAQDVRTQTKPLVATPFKPLRLDGNFVRWPKPDSMRDVQLTYRVAQEFQAFEGARNCRRMRNIDELAARSTLNRTQFDGELRAAFAMWESVANIRFREALPGEQANIIIGAQADPEGWAFADVFYDMRSPDTVKPISQALICLNPLRRWKVGFDGDLRVYDLRYTLAHEIGHAIGLDHPNSNNQVMGYRYDEVFTTLQQGDIDGAVALYGRRDAIGTSSVGESEQAVPSARPSKQWTSRALN